MKAVLLDADTLKPEELDISCLTDLPVSLTQYATTTADERKERVHDADIILVNKVVL